MVKMNAGNIALLSCGAFSGVIDFMSAKIVGKYVMDIFCCKIRIKLYFNLFLS